MDIFAEELDGVLNGRIPFTFHYQPVVDLQRGIAAGYESLVRFGGRLNWSPDRWFSAADNLGRKLELEMLVASSVLAARPILPQNCFLAVNASPALLLSEQWDELLIQTPALDGVVVEITEQDPITDYVAIQRKMSSIRAKGGMVAVDDVGSGYASLKHVMEVRPDFLKLDRGFIGGCHLDPARKALIEMIGTIAGRLDAWIIAEGVETRPELEQLIALDVSLAQGYHLGRPAPRMEPVSEHVQHAITTLSDVRKGVGIINCALERCSVHRSREDAHKHLDEFTNDSLAVVIDKWSGPLVLVERHPLLGIRALSSFLKVQIDSDLNEILHRALTRQGQLRFDPMAVINERGGFEGVARMDRLMFEALPKSALEKRPVARERVAGIPLADIQDGAAD